MNERSNQILIQNIFSQILQQEISSFLIPPSVLLAYFIQKANKMFYEISYLSYKSKIFEYVVNGTPKNICR
jgi:hypothetical protein